MRISTYRHTICNAEMDKRIRSFHLFYEVMSMENESAVWNHRLKGISQSGWRGLARCDGGFWTETNDNFKT